MIDVTNKAVNEFKDILKNPENAGKSVRLTFAGFG